VEHSDLRAIAADAGQLLLAEFRLFLLDDEEIDPQRFLITPAVPRAVLEATDRFRAKHTPRIPATRPEPPVIVAGQTVYDLTPDGNGRIAGSELVTADVARSARPCGANEAAQATAEDPAPQPPARDEETAVAQPSSFSLHGSTLTLRSGEPSLTTSPSDDWPAKLLAAGLGNGDARIVAQLDAGKAVWRDVRRDSQRRIIYALIRHLAADGEAATIKRYDASRPAWLPSAALLYQQFDEKWSETVAAAQAEQPAAPEVAAPEGGKGI
jgi:hypothetical protein